MKTLKYPKNYHQKDRPNLSSINHSILRQNAPKLTLITTTGLQYDKIAHKRCTSEGASNSPLSINSRIMKKLLSRPASPVAVPTKSLDYIPSSKIRKYKNYISKTSRNHCQQIQKLTQKIQIPNYCDAYLHITKRNTMKKSTISRAQRKTIKISHSPLLNDCPSMASIDYYIPRYQK